MLLLHLRKTEILEYFLVLRQWVATAIGKWAGFFLGECRNKWVCSSWLLPIIKCKALERKFKKKCQKFRFYKRSAFRVWIQQAFAKEKSTLVLNNFIVDCYAMLRVVVIILLIYFVGIYHKCFGEIGSGFLMSLCQCNNYLLNST